MKILLTICIVLAFSECFGQIVYDPGVRDQYNSLFKKLPVTRQKELILEEKNEPGDHGMAIFSKYESDTLNKEEKKGTTQEIVLEGVRRGQHHHSFRSYSEKDKYLILPCYNIISNDTLAIIIGGIFLDQAVMHFVSRDSVTILYLEHYKSDSILKLNANDSLSNFLNIPAKTIRFVLSDTSYKIGQMIYGSAEMITDDYFIKDSWEENHFYNLRWRMKYFFKFKVSDGRAHPIP